jgi:hypothetical protein
MLENLRKSREGAFKKLTEKSEEKSSSTDSRIWTYVMDKSDTASAVLRFLPAVGTDEIPYVTVFSYGFKGATGKWYIENSLRTIGENDPVAEANNALWETGIEENRKIVKARKRRVAHYSNVLVIKDPANPENEGKVFLFKYGNAIKDIIMSKLRPEFDDVEPLNVFDIDTGANFHLRVMRKDDYVNYDKSDFSSPKPLCDGDEAEMERVLGLCYNLGEFVAPDKFKSYDELNARFLSVTGSTSAQTRTKMPTPIGDSMEHEKTVDAKEEPVSDDIDDFFKELC